MKMKRKRDFDDFCLDERSLKTMRLMRKDDPRVCNIMALDTSSASACADAASRDGLPKPNLRGSVYRADPPGPGVHMQTREKIETSASGKFDVQTDSPIPQTNVIQPDSSEDELVSLIQKIVIRD